MNTEQRRAARKLLDSSGVLTIGGIAHDVRTVDVASGGLCAMLATSITVGRDCHVNFEVPMAGGMRTVAVSAHVVYCFKGAGGFKVGLQFLKVHADGADVIAEYVRLQP